MAFIGIYYHRRAKKWQAQIRNGKAVEYLGLHDTKELAAKAYDDRARELGGRVLNWVDPNDCPSPEPHQS